MGGHFRTRPLRLGLATALAGAWAPHAFAQQITTGAPDIETYRPEAVAVRIEAGEAPQVDGDISDPAWAKARVIDRFYVVEPVPGGTPEDPTEVRILYDRDNLYIAIHARYARPETLIASVKARDGDFVTGDFVRVYLDPGLTRRNGYAFEVNPLGARADKIVQNNATFIPEWDTIWTANSRMTTDGWTAEMAIPFHSLSYDPDLETWGFDFARLTKASGERTRWTSFRPSILNEDISRSGTLGRITDVGQGLGLEIQLYGTARYRHEWPNSDDDLTFSPSGNVFYRVTPALTATLTVNPDFSDAPPDLRRVNTTRFSLFTPETRDFFLQDVAIFEFGGINFPTFGNGQNARPFFSRNIGLAGGRPVGLYAGGKISGEASGLSIGALSVVTEKTDFVDSQVLSVARITAPVLERSKAGIILTNGDPNGLGNNTVAGSDFQYRGTWRGYAVQADAYYIRSFSDVAGDDDSFGVSYNFPNEPIRSDAHFKQIGEAFSPQLGFVNRKGIREYLLEVAYRERFGTSWLRWAEGIFRYSAVTGLDDELQSQEISAVAGIFTRSTDQGNITLFDNREIVPTAFFLPGGIPVPAGEYHWNTAKLSIMTSRGRAFSPKVDVFCCSFYNGDYFSIDATLEYRPDDTFQFLPRYIFTSIGLPTGSTDIHILIGDVAVNFTPDMQLRVQAQYDNITENFELSARYRWEYEPGEELFIAFGQTTLVPGTNVTREASQLSVRLGHTIRL